MNFFLFRTFCFSRFFCADFFVSFCCTSPVSPTGSYTEDGPKNMLDLQYLSLEYLTQEEIFPKRKCKSWGCVLTHNLWSRHQKFRMKKKKSANWWLIYFLLSDTRLSVSYFVRWGDIIVTFSSKAGPLSLIFLLYL